MSPDEMAAIMKAKGEAEKMTWEQTRLVCFYNWVSMNGTKTYKKPSDLFSLSWDKKKGKSMTSKEAQEKLKDNS